MIEADDLACTVDEAIAKRHTPVGTAVAERVKAATEAEVFLSVGTSALVQPAATLPLAAKRNEALLIEINIESTPLSSAADFFLEGGASEWLSLIKEGLQ